MKANKVTIEITNKGWKTTVLYNGKTYTDEHKRTITGSTSVGDSLENHEELPEELVEAITGGFKEYEIMTEL